MDPIDYLRFLAALGLRSRPDRAARLARPGAGASAARPPGAARRLAVVEVLPLDPRRKLVLVRCDQREHLLLLGQDGNRADRGAAPGAARGDAGRGAGRAGVSRLRVGLRRRRRGGGSRWLAGPALAQSLSVDLGAGGTVTGQLVRLVLLITVLSLAPSILVMVTSFTRIVVVLAFLRSALGLQQTPPNAVLISLALFLTAFVMAPTLEQA